MEFTKYNIKLYFLEFPPDSLNGAVSKNKDGSYSIYINKTRPVRLQELTILHEIAHIRLNHHESDKDADQMEAELRREYWWHDYYASEQEEVSKRKPRLKKAQEEYRKTKDNIGKFYLGDLEELHDILDTEGVTKALGVALEAGFMIGYLRKTFEVSNPGRD